MILRLKMLITIRNEGLGALNNYYVTEEQTHSQFVKEFEAINFALSDVVTGQLSLEPILIASFVSILPVVLKSLIRKSWVRPL